MLPEERAELSEACSLSYTSCKNIPRSLGPIQPGRRAGSWAEITGSKLQSQKGISLKTGPVEASGDHSHAALKKIYSVASDLCMCGSSDDPIFKIDGIIKVFYFIVQFTLPSF